MFFGPGFVTGFALSVLGTILLLRGLPGILQLLASVGWRRVPGRIVAAGTVGYLGGAGGGHGRARFTRGAVSYGYEVEGQGYVGSRVTFGSPLGYGMGLGGIARAQVARYAPGAAVDVWVHPRNPSRSVLRRSAPSSLVIGIAGAVVLALGVRAL